MAFVFPVAPVFPSPDWIESPVLPTSASAETTFINKSRSTLQLSEVLTDAEIVVRWEQLSYGDVLRFWPFWNRVENRESFTLPDEWWPDAMPPQRKLFYQQLSSTGRWRFKDLPVFDDRHDNQPTLVATLRGSID
jgi:hypothetical protein